MSQDLEQRVTELENKVFELQSTLEGFMKYFSRNINSGFRGLTEHEILEGIRSLSNTKRN